MLRSLQFSRKMFLGLFMIPLFCGSRAMANSELGDFVRFARTGQMGTLISFAAPEHGYILLSSNQSMLVALNELVPEPVVGAVGLVVLSDHNAFYTQVIVEVTESTLTLQEYGKFPRSALKRVTKNAHLRYGTRGPGQPVNVFLQLLESDERFDFGTEPTAVTSPQTLEPAPVQWTQNELAEQEKAQERLRKERSIWSQVILIGAAESRDNLFVVLANEENAPSLALAGSNDQSTRFIPRIFLDRQNPELADAKIEVKQDIVRVQYKNGSVRSWNIEEELQRSIRGSGVSAPSCKDLL